MCKLIKKSILLTMVVAPGCLFAADDVGELQKEIEALKEQNAIMMERLNATADALEQQSGPHSSQNSVSIGGYGEMHYNNLNNENPGGGDKQEMDFHRFVLFFGHEFSDTIRFFSELELEHSLAGEGKNGEVELEQALIEFDINDDLMLRGGLFLLPVGILNETHEPPTFYGVERNPVEKNIIPTTWWEGGAGISGRLNNGVSYDVAVHSGLNTDADSSYKVRSGRQKVSEAVADDLAYTGRIKWTGMPGLELAATYQYQQDITQSLDADGGSAGLIETHAVWQQGPFGLRALFASWNLRGSGPGSVGADEQSGWYIEPSYRLSSKWGVFARHNTWDNQAGDGADSEIVQIDIGANYWPHEDVVIKIDYQDQDTPDGGDELDGFNLGIGFQF